MIKKLYNAITRLPARSLHKWKTGQIIPFIILIVISGISLFRIDVASDSTIRLPEKNPYTQLEIKYREYFPSADFIIVTLGNENLFSMHTLEEVKRLTEQLQKIPEIRSVVSVSTTSDLVIGEEAIENIPLMAGEYDPGAIRDKITGNPLFNHFLLSDDGRLFSIYLFPDNDAAIDNSRLVKKIKAVTGEQKDFTVKVWGNRVIEYYLKETIIRDFLILGSLSLVIILVIQLLFARSLQLGLLLFLSSFSAAAITTALFPFFHLQLQTTTIMIPVVILALSTSYNIHLARYFMLRDDRNMFAALEHASPVILFTGASTMLGFLTLLLSSIPLLRQFGFILVLGILAAVLITLFFLPPLIRGITLPIKSMKDGRGIPVLKKSWSGLLVPALFLLLIFLGCAIPVISYDYRLTSLFVPRTSLYRDIVYFNRHFKGIDELELVIDSGAEYGLVNIPLYHALRKVEQEITGLEGVSRTIGFTTFVDWLQRKLSRPGSSGLVDSEESIGENLEILFSNETGLPVNILIDINYRYAKILIRFGTEISASSRQAVKLYGDLTRDINTFCKGALNGISYTLMGNTVQNEYVTLQLKRGQLISILSFMMVFGLILLFRFKSLKICLLILLPGISNVIFFMGIMGWLMIPLSANILLAVAVVMGVSTDDAVYFMLLYRSLSNQGKSDPLERTLALSGKAIIYTTVIIVLGISVLILSDYLPVIQTSLLIMSSLVFANLVTLFIVPGLLKYMVVFKAKPGKTVGGVL